MPDPGEPHRPNRANFASDEDYLSALEDYINIMYPASDINLADESRLGIRDLEQFLESHL